MKSVEKYICVKFIMAHLGEVMIQMNFNFLLG